MSKSNSKMLTAVLGGAAAGAILGVLLAPQSGKDTRKKIVQSTKDSAVAVEELMEQGKKTWYETKGKAKMGAGIAADELDEFIRHILNKGRSMWRGAKGKANDMANEAEGAYDSAMGNAKKTAHNVRESVSSNVREGAANVREGVSNVREGVSNARDGVTSHI